MSEQTISVEVLIGLVNRWQEKADTETYSSYEDGITRGQEWCADELRRAIEENTKKCPYCGCKRQHTPSPKTDD